MNELRKKPGKKTIYVCATNQLDFHLNIQIQKTITNDLLKRMFKKDY